MSVYECVYVFACSRGLTARTYISVRVPHLPRLLTSSLSPRLFGSLLVLRVQVKAPIRVFLLFPFLPPNVSTVLSRFVLFYGYVCAWRGCRCATTSKTPPSRQIHVYLPHACERAPPPHPFHPHTRPSRCRSAPPSGLTSSSPLSHTLCVTSQDLSQPVEATGQAHVLFADSDADAATHPHAPQ